MAASDTSLRFTRPAVTAGALAYEPDGPDAQLFFELRPGARSRRVSDWITS
jgi:hypothetical protein